MRRARQPLTLARLHELLAYDKETGIFTRKITVNSRAIAGQRVGFDDGHGYLQVCIDRVTYQLGPLAWFYVNGKWPSGDIDHRDTDKKNNSFSNLRDVPHQANVQNIREATRRNRLGVLGVVARGEKFEANIKTNGKAESLGSFDAPDLAHAAYVEAKRQRHEGCTL